MKVNIDNIQYHVEVSGEGFPFLLLHGFTGDSSTWTPFLKYWDKHSQVIIPDIVGHGKTDSPDNLDDYKIETAAKHLKLLLEHLGIQKVDLLGYSMGGRLALTFAILYPERVRKLILESASPGLNKEVQRQERRMKDAELAKFITDQGINDFVDYWENISLFSPNKNLPLSIQNKIRHQRLSNSAKGLANSLCGMGTGSQPSWWERLNDLHCEVLLLTGIKDEKFCSIAKEMQKCLKNVNWIVFYQSGHTIHVEEEEKFGTIVSDFVSLNQE
ncbi:2-succinyl-6-hydroxy-2,4-cyclohexadiene-1-carboxylate synthase [Bacillus sp. MRMR6]|uniref:2-succinyl-6-hydroxy-2, 4-cyclohexadiene-1-carboxylate synthase n=1 Tax=Bacillus sp. MRMR6 TaxID=1928617 RepID=UPI0009513E9B|nr:2-succinyl-6-hydroxy-2,4-cyclohexadiene-1-carboxylate synthase [Bacillus sp. MRMR6]OLS35808.1 2-succinyl-6-hydroxy-2,4-cyclohexadiene-1-carboxylate synthase [Bacillus sp. MRMR6]